MHIYKKIAVGIVSGAMALSFGLIALAQVEPSVVPVPAVKSVSDNVSNTTGQINETRKKEMEALKENRQKETEVFKEARQKETENIKNVRQN